MSTLNQSFVGTFSSDGSNPGYSGGPQPLIGRVTHVVQGPNITGTDIPDPFYTDPTSLGCITFQLLTDVQNTTLASGNQLAKPIFAGFMQYPIENEIVSIIAGPSVGMNESREQRDFYYFPPYNLWNASHHNAFPDMGDYGGYVSTVDRTYQNSAETNQAINASATGSLTFPLGPNFREKPDVKNLRPFTGDVIVEGRWGNSIRLGSTSATGLRENTWSEDSNPGNPITIIRNGQGRTVDTLGWVPTVEDVNRDPTSIYLTQGQKIVIRDVNNNFSLASLQVALQSVDITAIPIQQQLTSTDSTSPQEQDAFVNNRV